MNTYYIITFIFCLGFCSLALAFFGVGSLPKRYGEIRVEYFEQAIQAAATAAAKEGTTVDKSRVRTYAFYRIGYVAKILFPTGMPYFIVAPYAILETSERNLKQHLVVFHTFSY